MKEDKTDRQKEKKKTDKQEMKEEKTDRQKEKKDRQIGKNINTKRKKKTNEQKEKKTADRILSKCNHHHNHHHHHHYIHMLSC